jgi:hypothetical protein
MLFETGEFQHWYYVNLTTRLSTEIRLLKNAINAILINNFDALGNASGSHVSCSYTARIWSLLRNIRG